MASRGLDVKKCKNFWLGAHRVFLRRVYFLDVRKRLECF
jgi:hypothetical protein